MASLNARQFVRGVDSTVINDSMPSTDRSGAYRGQGNALYLKDLGSGRTSESTRKMRHDEEVGYYTANEEKRYLNLELINSF